MGCAQSTTPGAEGATTAMGAASNLNRAIPDQFETFEELQGALRRQGLESSNLIIGIDYTKSNTWTGKVSFDGKCLHDIDPSKFLLNPYQASSVISIIGRTLEPFDDDNLIPAFGFGDATTGDKGVFPLMPLGKPCQGFGEVLRRYDEITSDVVLAGPTNFAPIIYEAIRQVKATSSYHILVIIADGQVTNEKETSQAIVEASKYALSIIVVGVGDGPWELMEHYDDALPARKFDNFQFVDFNRVMKFNQAKPDIGFATAALMEIPEQFKIIRSLKYLG
ncbi:hypothetical protein PybrP1_004659 [[Pythium] brassicae (nom. inval.)]|nr:hypothetical protein PybrP1_004659 [[Pythium] brassicae (nom. inval.)]